VEFYGLKTNKMKLFRNLFKRTGFKIASDKGNEILKHIAESDSNVYKQKIIKLYNLHFVVGRSEQCCLNPKHRTESNDMCESWVICGNCGKEIV
jgi:hypothetical protein